MRVVDALADRIRDGRLALRRQARHRVGADGRVRRQPHRRSARRCRSCRRRRWCRRATASAPSSPTAASIRRCSGSAPTSSRPCTTSSPCSSCGSASRPRPPAWRRSAARDDNLAAMRRALIAFTQAVEAGRDAVGPDFQFHLEIARATQNPHFSTLLQSLGTATIPRARLDPSAASADERPGLPAPRQRRARQHRRRDREPGRRGGARSDAHPPRQQPRAAPARGAAGQQLTAGRTTTCRRGSRRPPRRPP